VRFAALAAAAAVPNKGSPTSTKPHALEAAIAAAPDAASISKALQAAVVRGSVQPGPRTPMLLLRKLLGLAPDCGRAGAAAAALPDERLRAALAVLLEPRFRLPCSGAVFALLLDAAPRAPGGAPLVGEVVAAARARGVSRGCEFVKAAVRATLGAGAIGEAVRVVREGAAVRGGPGSAVRLAAGHLRAALDKDAGGAPWGLGEEDARWCREKLPTLCAGGGKSAAAAAAAPPPKLA
jgi:hypothetical protein